MHIGEIENLLMKQEKMINNQEEKMKTVVSTHMQLRIHGSQMRTVK